MVISHASTRCAIREFTNVCNSVYAVLRLSYISSMLLQIEEHLGSALTMAELLASHLTRLSFCYTLLSGLLQAQR